ncbi:ammonium transporter (TC 1.A.11) [Chthonomonas calidirosea]|uniref:Ammonium transporter n=1 Tax=Chthonomonas calidirosea (strain DSM 23976 / ICMP 18418 / T49) TaxID=1303518 RepID=S0ET45_CHTCT|nr:ammonium transporter [Chthonomonas calidirosea]CCW34220.1 ammonium transporter (TC 1.A.11) [Chthonomonas calidirosea T49]CEK15414.1 ammonium transporter (TC 1.A.11) [Chthonomonas calidirosea]
MFHKFIKSNTQIALTAATTLLIILLANANACAQPPTPSSPAINTGDTAWMLVAAAFVMLMTPGLAFFYGGMVRSKNVLNMLMQSFVALGIVTFVWLLWGYSLAFAPGNPFIGSLQWFGLNHVGETPSPYYAPTVPHQVYMIYQLMFAIITPALISGAIAERMKFSTYVVFITLWSTFIYCPLAHWVWGHNGWLNSLGALDFAGGTVVHISSGVSALVLAIALGRRYTDTLHTGEEMRPHNLTMTLVGTALLWFGWFGFNAGSALASGGLASSAFVATHIAASIAGLTWILIEWSIYKKPTALGFATGAVAGLVAITPASGYVGPIPALLIGVGVAFISFYAIKLKHRFHYDDALDVFGVHGMGGIWGALATGLFASVLVNGSGSNGLFYGGGLTLFIKQTIAVASAVAYAAIGTWILTKILSATMGLRVNVEDENIGLDLTQHGESAYVMAE